MALLNKLFFPSSSTSSAAASVSATSSPATVPTFPWTTNASSSSLSRSNAAAHAAVVTGVNAPPSNRRQNNQSVHSKNYLSQFPFDGHQVRVLLYRECDSRGRRLLFDSNALEKVYIKEPNANICKSEKNVRSSEDKLSASNSNATLTSSTSVGADVSTANKQRSYKGNSNDFITVCEEYGFKHNRPNSADITTIGEMVFGALAMSFRGTALKVHWLQEPSRILCSQVFLTPVASSASVSQSQYSVISPNSLATPRTSISSEQGSMDGLSMNSFSMPFSVSVDHRFSLSSSDRSLLSSPLDVPDQQSISALSIMSDSARGSSMPHYSSTYSTVTDSGYSGISRSQLSSDQWSASYQYSSTRSSMGSVMSENSSEALRKLSMDSMFFPSNQLLNDAASDGSLQRRICRNLRTSFENECSVNDLIGFLSDNYTNVGGSTTNGGSEGASIGGLGQNYRRASYSTNESRSNPEMGKRRDAGNGLKSVAKRGRLGLAVCITMSESFEDDMELFCSEHVALLESMLSRLRACTERAYINHKEFLQTMYQAWQGTTRWFNDLFTAPRIKCPVWLSITTSGSKYSKNVADRFIKELCWLLSFADTKDTHFFVSTMLTAILTHHLGWVSTVAAFNSTSAFARSEKSAAAIEQRAKLLQVSQKHPYNALWAQMGDLYGAIGLPPKLTRTIIYGTEKLSMERLLNILTYFIRCGEVRRSGKREDFNKDLINTIVSQSKNETLKKFPSSSRTKKAATSSGLTRTQTCKQNLDTIPSTSELSHSASSSSNASSISGEVPMELHQLSTLKKNEIPNVFAFRDSRFVQQELRIGNYLMDTGIEKHQAKQANHTKSTSINKDGHIKLMVTTPDNVEMCVEDEIYAKLHADVVFSSEEEEAAVEAIEIDVDIPDSHIILPKRNSSVKKNFLWKIVPETVKEGFSFNDLQRLQSGVGVINQKLQRRCSSFSNQSDASTTTSCCEDEPKLHKNFSHLSLSDLITQNSMGKSERMTWGIEPIKENVSLEEQIHFDLGQRLIEREHGIRRNDADNNNVVFVLGDNEPLVNIKKSTEDLHVDSQQQESEENDKRKPNNCQTLCQQHQRTHGPMTQYAKKHSGVKFNFEQFPQIATNYMRSKNLVMSNYDLLMDKCSKLEAASAGVDAFFPNNTTTSKLNGPIINSSPPNESSSISASASLSISSSTECIVCTSILNSYQTPSNATELEFETDEVHCHSSVTPSASTTKTSNASDTTGSVRSALHTVGSAASIVTLKSTPLENTYSDNKCDNITTIEDKQQQSDASTPIPPHEETSTVPAIKKTPTFNSNTRKNHSHRGSTSSVAAKCAAVNEAVHLLKLPVPGIKELPQEDEPPDDMKLRAGFIPSLFLNVNDHYIPDMVLQGTYAPPNTWESNLREDLALAACSASLISLPAENIAIVADMDKWDVRLISSQCQPHYFPSTLSTTVGTNASATAPVGMSQLVSTMLETVQAMNSSGISAYECLSYIESKMQEIYLQSETLAAFLLETDFCPLSAVTTALNLTENDVPLLLSIASIHTPQISKKCGISFR